MEVNELRKDTDFEAKGIAVGDFLAGLEAKRQAQLHLVPTATEDVKALLRELEQPITVFGEDDASRRERLKEFVAANNIDLGLRDDEDAEMGDGDLEEEEDEEFYTPASMELLEARKLIREFSLARSEKRLETQREISMRNDTEQLVIRREQIAKFKPFELAGSQLVSTRPVSKAAINQTTNEILAGSWAGEVCLLTEDLNISKTFESSGKIGGLDWSPTKPSYFISSGNGIELYDTASPSDLPIATYVGHEGRIVESQFHPTGRYIATASYDLTWRLWDVETRQELLLQEGHSKEVHSLSFHTDGSLLASAGLDAIGLVWDLRTGKSIIALEGHVKPIYAIRWRDNGYHIATGGADGSVKVWDLRMNGACLADIPAHTSVVSDLEFSGSDNVLVSSSFDGSVKVWACDSWAEVKDLRGHDGKVMGVSIAGERIVSCGWDRSVKMWRV